MFDKAYKIDEEKSLEEDYPQVKVVDLLLSDLTTPTTNVKL